MSIKMKDIIMEKDYKVRKDNLEKILPKFQESLKKFEAQYEKQIREYWTKYFNDAQKFETPRKYLQSIFGDQYVSTKRYYGSPQQELDNYTSFEKKYFDPWLKKKVDYEIEMAEGKVKQSVFNYLTYIDNIEKVEAVSVKVNRAGFEGTWKIFTNDDEILFRTEAILAGGYNIQQLHVRYLTKIKSLVKKVDLKRDITKRIQTKSTGEKDAKRQEKLKIKQQKDREKEVKKLVTLTRKLKDEMYWAWWGVRNAKEAVRQQSRADAEQLLKQNEEEYKIVKQEFDKFYIENQFKIENSKPRYKKDELTKMAEDGKLDYLKNLKWLKKI